MKHTLFILALLTATIQTFAQSPRIKLNQITKDSITGSVLISSPTDSGMVYSRDLFVSYGADTFLILGGDTIVLQSDLIAEIGDSLLNYVSRTELSDSTTNIRTDIPLIIADSLLNYVNISGTQTITGAKTFTSALTQSGGDVNFDSGTFFVDESENRVGIGTSSPSVTLDLGIGDKKIKVTEENVTEVYIEGGGVRLKNIFASGGWARAIVKYQDSSEVDYFSLGGFGDGQAINYIYLGPVWNNPYQVWKSNGDVGIGTTSPNYKLEVNGKVKISDLTGTGGNAVYENGGVLGVASDARFKTFISDLDNGIEKVLNLKPKYFIDNRNSAFQQLGFYAQEVKSVINEASYPIGNTDYYGINDRAIISVTVKAIQEQQAIIESQAIEIETLKTLITELSNRLTILENN